MKPNQIYKINISELMKLEIPEIFLFEILKPFGFHKVDQIIKAICFPYIISQ